MPEFKQEDSTAFKAASQLQDASGRRRVYKTREQTATPQTRSPIPLRSAGGRHDDRETLRSPNPRFPLYIVSKGRVNTRFTSRALEATRTVLHRRGARARRVRSGDRPEENSRSIKLFNATTIRSTASAFGRAAPQPACNFARARARERRRFTRSWTITFAGSFAFTITQGPRRRRYRFSLDEDFVSRYENVGIAGPNYFIAASRKTKIALRFTNTRIYSRNLIRTDLSLRQRGRYNEDTDLSLRYSRAVGRRCSSTRFFSTR